MLQARFSAFLQKAVSAAGFLPWWEQNITAWPRVVFYHYIGDSPPGFLRDIAINKDAFLEQIAALRRRYRFLSWQEYKEALHSPHEAKRSVLITIDDGFRSTWVTMNELAAEQKIPSLFFLNTRVLDNAYAPWMVQRYFLRDQGNGRFLEPLWRSISNSQPLSNAATRKRCHEIFSLSGVVQPIEEGLAGFGLTPAELAQQHNLYIGTGDMLNRHDLVEIGNHSHSHYILSKLSLDELRQDLRSSHQILETILGAKPDCFAYPFGVPEKHFSDQCLRALRDVSSYPYVFSATDGTSLEASELGDLSRICLENVSVREILTRVAKVSPRALKKAIIKP